MKRLEGTRHAPVMKSQEKFYLKTRGNWWKRKKMLIIKTGIQVYIEDLETELKCGNTLGEICESWWTSAQKSKGAMINVDYHQHPEINVQKMQLKLSCAFAAFDPRILFML